MSWLSERIRAVLLAATWLAVLLAAPVLADEAKDKAALDQLFAELRLAPDAQTAHRIDQKIWIYWTTPSDPMLALRMADVLEARRAGDIPAAIELADSLIEDYPPMRKAGTSAPP